MVNKKARTKCEVWSRVVGYLRPTARWNDGKLAEFGDRVVFKRDNEKNDKGDDKSENKDEKKKEC